MTKWSLEGKEIIFLFAGEQSGKFYAKKTVETLHKELNKDKQELQNKILFRIAGLLFSSECTNSKNTSQLRLDISAIINEEFSEFEEKMNRCFGVEE